MVLVLVVPVLEPVHNLVVWVVVVLEAVHSLVEGVGMPHMLVVVGAWSVIVVPVENLALLPGRLFFDGTTCTM